MKLSKIFTIPLLCASMTAHAGDRLKHALAIRTKAWSMVLCAACMAFPAAGAPAGYMAAIDNYFEWTYGTDTILVLVFDRDFHTCGWNQAGSINLSVIGPEAFRQLNAVALTAIATGRTLLPLTAGCTGDRALLRGLKLGPEF